METPEEGGAGAVGCLPRAASTAANPDTHQAFPLLPASCPPETPVARAAGLGPLCHLAVGSALPVDAQQQDSRWRRKTRSHLLLPFATRQGVYPQEIHASGNKISRYVLVYSPTFPSLHLLHSPQFFLIHFGLLDSIYHHVNRLFYLFAVFFHPYGLGRHREFLFISDLL